MQEALNRAPNQETRASTDSTESPLQRLILSLDRPFKFATNLTSLGVVGVIIASIIQYSAWRDEKNLTRHREELTSAISSFSEISGVLSAAMNLQQILYYTYQMALGYDGSVDELTVKHLSTNAKATWTDYFSSRISLRKNIDVLIAKADLYIDRPTKPESQRVISESPDDGPRVFSSRDSLTENGFVCKEHMPAGPAKVTVGKITLSWKKVKHHVATFYYCLEELHTSLLPIRVWASMNATGDAQPIKIADDRIKVDEHIKLSKERMEEIKEDLNLQTRRLNALIVLSTAKIEEVRLRTKENGFFRHQFCFFCNN
jgi:hypothetical protein